MDDTLTQLALACIEQQEVGLLTRSDGTVLLVYPLAHGAAVGVGTGPGFERKLRSILRRRSANMPRYGNWLPTLLNDGSCFVITRVRDIRHGGVVLDPHILNLAVELIS